MHSVVRTLAGVLVFTLTFWWSGPAMATDEPSKGRDVKPTQEWAGSVEDNSLQKEAPARGFITDEKAFGKLWQAWKPGEKVPEVDFKKELVLVETTSGSLLHVGVRLTKDGDLKVLGAATRDFRPGFRYRILVVPRAGVKTINGRELPGN